MEILTIWRVYSLNLLKLKIIKQIGVINYNYIGNLSILDFSKTAFLCSRKCPAEIILKSYDWAIEQRKKGNCIISGFHSKIEKDVLHYLLKGTQPVILALARGLKKREANKEIVKAINEKRLLIITPFEKKIKRVTQKTAKIRNEFMAKLSDEIFIAYASKGGNIDALKRKYNHSKKISTL